MAICAIEHVTHDYYFHYFLHKYKYICPPFAGCYTTKDVVIRLVYQCYSLYNRLDILLNSDQLMKKLHTYHNHMLLFYINVTGTFGQVQ